MRKKAEKNRINSRKFTVALTAVITAVCLLLSSCGNEVTVGVRSIGSVASRNVISSPSEKPGITHYSGSIKSFEDTGVASGLIELWVDRDTCSFGIFDTSANVLWTALPLRSEVRGGLYSADNAAVVSLRIIGKTDIYSLNSQDNSVEYGTAAMVEKDGSYSFSYSIFDSRETAKKSSFSPDDIGFRVELDVALKDGNMTVGCTCENITGNTDAYIEDIEILNYFGAYNDSSKGNFLFVPDGCGAVIDTGVYDESFESLSFSVYGEDLSNPSGTDGSAIVPAFGIKRNNAAFVSLIEYGDAVATVHADKATSFAAYNRVYPSFNITPGAYENNTLYISNTATVKEVRMCYRFLSAFNASYAGMASAVREQLIRNGVLSAGTAEQTDYLPFYVTLTGTVRKEFGKLSYNGVLTDFDQARDMLIRMKNKGIDNINVRYASVFSGGGETGDVKKAVLSGRVGGQRGFNKLSEYMSGQNMTLFIDTDILSSVEDFGGNNTYSIFKEPNLYYPENPLNTAVGSSVLPRYLRKISDLRSTVLSVLTDFRSYGISGICLNDVGSRLYSDFSKDGMLRQDASEMIAGTVSPLSTSNEIMIDRGNFYMLKNADSVINLPLSTTVSKTGSYTPVPFVQLILHGILDYSGEAINEQKNRNEIMLRCLEYGACPHFRWNYTAINETAENDIYYYDNTINDAAVFYADANRLLNSLRDARMTDHYEVSDGVFCTEYDTGTMIYVNYTDSDCTVLGSVVRAGNFLRVN